MAGTKIEIGSLEEICKKVLEFDPKIRFVSVLSEKGALLTSHKKEGIKLLLNERHQEMLFMEAALVTRMHKEYDEELGKLEFVSIDRERIVLVGVPFDGHLLYLTAEKSIDLKKTVSKILSAIKFEYNTKLHNNQGMKK